MLLYIDRFLSDKNSTLSNASVDGVFECFFLEDAHQTKKIYGKTRIPAGLYKIQVRKHGGFHARYSKRFNFHRGMLEIMDIPGFTNVLLHIGNTHHDTLGCPLSGLTALTGDSISVGQSTKAYEKLYKKVITAAELGTLMLRIVDNDLKHAKG